jgi:hypothetical protein
MVSIALFGLIPQYVGGPSAEYCFFSHVVLVTYEIITSQKDFSMLSNKVPRWECLIVE